MQSYEEFAVKHGLSLKAAHVRRTKNADGWEHDLWSCRLIKDQDYYQFPFRMGTGHNRKAPDMGTVLNSLALDSQADTARSFEDWCAEYGYDDDSRKAEAIYDACRETASELKRLLGGTAFAELLFETEEG